MLICFLNQNAIYLKVCKKHSPSSLKGEKSISMLQKDPSGMHKTKCA